jgi:hypothetical protein
MVAPALQPVLYAPAEGGPASRKRGRAMESISSTGSVKVQFVPVGRQRREWMWKARGEDSNTISISGQRFDSLTEAVRDAREQLGDDDEPDDDGPEAA